MKKNNARVVVVTNDSLMSSLSEHNGAHSAKANAVNIDYAFFNHIPERQELASSDAIIFDVDTSNDAKGILSKVFNESDQKPVILTGDRTSIKTLTSSADVRFMIHRAIPKPVSIPIFEIAIATATAHKSSKSSTVTSTNNTSYQPLIAGSLLTVAFIATIAYVIFSGEPQTNLSNKSVADSIVNTAPFANQNDELNQGKDEQKDQKVEQLINLATEARSGGNLALPAKANAIYYYQQALLIDRYNSQAYKGLELVIQEVRNSVPRIINAGKLDTAAQLLEILNEATPFAPENKYLIASYQAAKRALDSNDKTVSAKPNSESDTTLTKNPDKSADSPAAISDDSEQTISTATLDANKQDIEQDIEQDISDASQKEPLAGQKEPLAGQKEPLAVLMKKAPKYPKNAVKIDLEGWVELSYQVDTNGNVINAKAVAGEPNGYFNRAGLRAIKQWKFQPAVDPSTGDKIISPILVKKFNFKLNSSS